MKPSAAVEFCAGADFAPATAGAYVLQVNLRKTLSVSIAGRRAVQLPRGRYLYCGSANGPGGLKARLARHVRRGKPMRWHIDQLTNSGTVAGCWIVRNGRECDLIAMLAPLPMPIAGFGSTDCSRCISHLLYWPSETPVCLPQPDRIGAFFAPIRDRRDAPAHVEERHSQFGYFGAGAGRVLRDSK